MPVIIVVLLSLVLVLPAQAKLITQILDYTVGETRCRGYLAFDNAVSGIRPGVLVVHEWWGLNDFAKKKARELARLGYVALAADIYGEGAVTEHPQEAAQFAAAVRGTPLMRQRSQTALQTLAGQPEVNPRRLAAIGFCFGGTAVLELAYSGAALAGVVSFHGSPTTPAPEDPKPCPARILVLHGADDPLVSPEQLTAFMAAMREHKYDWQMIFYGGAMHSFTNPGAGRVGIKGAAYDHTAAARSWRHMLIFFEEIFGSKPVPPLRRLID